MQKLWIVVSFLLIATPSVWAQTEAAPSCDVLLVERVRIRGLSLGMKPEEWMKLFPGSEVNEEIKSLLSKPAAYPGYGMEVVEFSQPNSGGKLPYLSPFRHEGIGQVNLVLFDNRLIDLVVIYENKDGPSLWDKPSTIAEKFIQTFDLPSLASWEVDANSASLNCKDAKLILSGSGRGFELSLGLKKHGLEKIKQRREADKQKRRDAFKP